VRHALLLALVLVGVCSASPALELVESYPSETDFDQPDIRNTQEVWLELIDGAQNEILWQTFYVVHQQGEATGPVLEALKRAAKRGVKIQLLVDPKFVKTYPETLDELAALDNIEVRHSPVGEWLGGVMHAKMMLVDGHSGFLGSQNFDWRSLDHIRELGIVFRNATLVGRYADVFRWEWDHHEDIEPPTELPYISADVVELDEGRVLPTFSPNPLNKNEAIGDEYQILRLLSTATRSVDVALLSYSPLTHDGSEFYPELETAIRSAEARGVRVRLVVSHWMEEKDELDHLLSLDALDGVEVRACRVAPAASGEIPFARVHHSKYLVVDGEQAWLGTANWGHGYFHESRNYGMVFLSGSIPGRLQQLFDFDWTRSTTLEGHRQK
jgi:phosphatidylserine/phosphatidylglycerophosphate/cardiolipin synthase-like enzyme